MRIFFSVGEPSGDEHASQLIRELQRRSPEVQAVGFGGERMKEAGCELDFKLTDLAVMGIVRVLPHLAKFVRLARQARRIFETQRPDAVVLVDFPGFNWHVARHAKACGIPVFYYLPPQIWAWASWRVERMRRDVDHILCCLPFEPKWYEERGLTAEFVGHPTLEAFDDKALDPEFADGYGPEETVVGILPGSRNQEVTANWPLQLEVARLLHERLPGTRFAVACYKPAHLDFCKKSLTEADARLPIDFHVGKTSEIIDRAAACLMVSGSVSLELLARGTPAVVVYRGSWFLKWFGLRMIQCNYMSLPNLLAERMVMPEFPLAGCPRVPVNQMADTLRWWLTDPEELSRRTAAMLSLRDAANVSDPIGKAAESILQKLPAPAHSQAA